MVNKTATTPLIKRVYDLLGKIPDPEIPVINIVELGIVREVIQTDSGCKISISPTYSGCPAMDQIKEDIKTTLRKNGVEGYELATVLSPAWTTDMMWISAKEKLKNYGIAPPCAVKAVRQSPNCPRCDSVNVSEISYFSSTACKSLYKCLDCFEPFDYFKSH